MLAVTVSFPGTSCGLPETDRFFSSYLIGWNDSLLVLDVSEGTLRALIPHLNENKDRPVTVALSHSHPDHWSGLFLLVQYFHQIKRTEPWQLHLPEHLFSNFQDLARLHYLFKERMSVFPDVYPVQSDRILLGDGLILTPVKNSHVQKYEKFAPAGSLQSWSFRIENLETERWIGFTMDVGTVEDVNLLSANSPTELLILDGSHLSAGEIRTVVDGLMPVSWIISHYPEKIKSEFPFHCLATDGQYLEVTL